MKLLVLGIIISLVLTIVTLALLVSAKNVLISRVVLSDNIKRASDNLTISFFLSGLILIVLSSLLLASFYEVISHKVIVFVLCAVMAILLFLFIIAMMALSTINNSPEVTEISQTNGINYLKVALVTILVIFMVSVISVVFGSKKRTLIK